MDRSAVARALHDTDRTVSVVAGISLLALLARLLFLGDRVAHFDEGRVAYWAMEYQETGAISYRFIVHGPFVQYVDRWVFALLGPTDFSMRLVVAVVGALLPLVALLLRDRLRDTEVVAMAALLAFNPVLLYYSRFYRSSLLVAAFMTAALAVGLRAADRRRPTLLYAAALLAAFGFASKENAVLYVLCWLGAGALLLDFALVSPRTAKTGSGAVVERAHRFRSALGGRAGRSRARTWGLHVVGAAALFLLVSFYFYAPRAPGDGVGLWETVFNPLLLPELLDATWADIDAGLNYWFGGSVEPGCNEDNLVDGYWCYLEQFVGTMGRYAAVTSTFAVLGFLVERYTTDRPRPLVMFASYWGVASVLGYPLGTDIYGAWITVNALVPLTIPAAVGLSLVGRWGWEAFVEEDHTGTALTAVLFLAVAGLIVGPAVGAVYVNPTADENGLVQYAQPQQEFRPTLQDTAAIAATHEGTDLLFYGEELVADPQTAGPPEPKCTRMVATLPLHWYIRADDVATDCAYDSDALDKKLGEDPPPVIIAHVGREDEVASRLDGEYDRRNHHLRTMGREVVVFVDKNALASAYELDRAERRGAGDNRDGGGDGA